MKKENNIWKLFNQLSAMFKFSIQASVMKEEVNGEDLTDDKLRTIYIYVVYITSLDKNIT